METFEEWLAELQDARRSFVEASRRNKFDRGIWNTTVEKYADPAHFVFELLQNAEDAGATWAAFRLLDDVIEFEHDGEAFDREDIEGVTGIGNTTKWDEPKKIGCFGIGFKSVYVVTTRPEVHCDIEGRRIAFAIEDLVVPQLIGEPVQSGTTVIRLPLDRRDPADVLSQVGAALDRDGGRSLLFLDSLKALRWSGAASSGSCSVEDAGRIRTIRCVKDGEALQSLRHVIFSRPVRRDGDKREYSVKVAYPLNAGGEIFAEPAPTKLHVFFETEDSTGLRFRAHGPFQLTDNRANLKRGDPWNERLVGELAELTASSLSELRDEKLLTRGLLEALPNANDTLLDGWDVLRDRLAKAFASDALLPASEGGHVKVGEAFRGPADVRDVLGDEGLRVFARKAGCRWVAAGLRGRADAFIAAVGVEEFGLLDLLAAFTDALTHLLWRTDQDPARSWFAALPDEHLQRLYLVIDAATKQARRANLSNVAFVRLEDGTDVVPAKARLAPKADARGAEPISLDGITVRASLVKPGRGRGPDVEAFLRRMNVKDISEADLLRAVLARHYGRGATPPTAEQHLSHMRRLVAHHAQTGDASLVYDLPFLRAEGAEGYRTARQLYFGKEHSKAGLEHIYDGRVPGRTRRPLWSGYARLGKQKELRAFLLAAGVEDRLWVEQTSATRNPLWRELSTGFGQYRNTTSGTNEDYVIPQLEGMLALKDVRISRIVWDAVMAAGPGSMFARWSPNQQHTAKSRPSQLAAVLRDTPWLPDKTGQMRLPSKITASELAEGFQAKGAEEWLQAIGFAAESRERQEQTRARRLAAQTMGLPPELADRLSGLSDETRQALAGEMLRRIEEGTFARPQFPERESPNPDRRAGRVAERAREAPAKAYEVRQRSVRTSDGDVRPQARTFLRDQYTNEAGEMVCQACHDEMPFRLADGQYYFEAAALLKRLPVELAENHLALCPNCAAKWLHARGSDDQVLVDGVLDTGDLAVTVELAGADVAVRFTSVHLEDVRAALGEVLDGSPGDVTEEAA